MATRDEALEHLQRFAALTAPEANALLEAVVGAMGDEAIDAIADEQPLPTAVAEARAARVARISRRLGRLLRPLEIEVLLRVPRSTATGIVNRVRATYPQLVEDWTRQLVGEQAEEPEDISTDDEPDRWRVVFNDPVVIDYAYDLLRREGMTRNIVRRRTEQALVFPAQVRDRHGEMRNVFEVIGVTEPQ